MEKLSSTIEGSLFWHKIVIPLNICHTSCSHLLRPTWPPCGNYNFAQVKMKLGALYGSVIWTMWNASYNITPHLVLVQWALGIKQSDARKVVSDGSYLNWTPNHPTVIFRGPTSLSNVMWLGDILQWMKRVDNTRGVLLVSNHPPIFHVFAYSTHKHDQGIVAASPSFLVVNLS